MSRATVSLHSGPAQPFLEVRVDPVADTIVLSPFRDAPLAADVLYRLEVGEVRDLDGRSAEPITVVFETGRAGEPPPPEGETPWSEVQAVFVAGCVAGCHDAETLAAGLDLSTLDATRATAVGVASAQTGGTGARALRGLDGMGVIEPGDPSRSYLIYKMLGDPHIWGEVMPPEGPLRRSATATVADWILGGAR